MRRPILLLAGSLLAGSPAMADALIANRMIKAQSVISAEDVTLVSADIPGALTDVGAATGLETRIAIYPGRPIMMGDLGAPALVERNQPVLLTYRKGTLAIQAEGRALARGRAGDTVRAMNLGSRMTVTGRVAPDGSVVVGQEAP